MSDPAKTQEEIEDVLASIRRLVADNSAAQEAPVTVEGRRSPEPVEALVLSPLFRVEEPEDATEGMIDTPEGDAVAEAGIPQSSDTLLGGALQLGDPVDDTAFDEEATQTDWEPDDRLVSFDVVGDEAPEAADPGSATVKEDASGSSADPGPEPAVSGFAETIDEADADPVGEADLATQDVSQEDLDDLRRLDNAGDALEDFEPESGDENWPGEGAESALLSLVAGRDRPGLVDEDDAWHQDADVRYDLDALDDADREIADVVKSETPIAADIAKTEGDTPIAQDEPDIAMGTAPDGEMAETPADEYVNPFGTPAIEGPFSPSEPVRDDAHGDAEDAAEDAAEKDVLPGLLEDEGSVPPPVFSRRGPGGDSSTDPQSTEGADQMSETDGEGRTPAMALDLSEAGDGILDEDTLREIIADVVREELQGVLGQRITRNVRKMVRREIRLALAAEDLD